MYKIVPTKLAVSDTKLIVGRKVLAELEDAETADKIYETMVDMYLSAKKHGACDAMVIGGLIVAGVGLAVKGFLVVKDLRK
jgi:hypothetical protein